jgi:hypothetical protein
MSGSVITCKGAFVLWEFIPQRPHDRFAADVCSPKEGVGGGEQLVAQAQRGADVRRGGLPKQPGLAPAGDTVRRVVRRRGMFIKGSTSSTFQEPLTKDARLASLHSSHPHQDPVLL